ncbi:MAG: DUF1643 domain-containing protein [Chloroflexi bacterium]|nr:DUF1643 domain-containing protein [Chloroflexota bacterium]
MSTVFSDDRRYRYRLERQVCLLSEGLVQFIMLNPSTADETADDPTIRRCIDFTRRWGFGRLVVCNLFPYRATDPRELRREHCDALALNSGDPVWLEQRRNWKHIEFAANEADRIVVAWGTHGEILNAGDVYRRRLTEAGYRLHVLGMTKDGQPKHPLYVPAATELQPCPPTVDG